MVESVIETKPKRKVIPQNVKGKVALLAGIAVPVLSFVPGWGKIAAVAVEVVNQVVSMM